MSRWINIVVDIKPYAVRLAVKLSIGFQLPGMESRKFSSLRS